MAVWKEYAEGYVLREVTVVHQDLEKGHCCNSNPVARFTVEGREPGCCGDLPTAVRAGRFLLVFVQKVSQHISTGCKLLKGP